MDILHKLQKKFIRLATSSDKYEHAAPLLKQFEILNVYDLFKSNVACFTYNIINKTDKFPHERFSEFITKNSDIHPYRTRNRNAIRSVKANKSLGEKSVKVEIYRAWKTIPIEIKESKSTKAFKKNLKSWLLKEYR